MLTVLSKKLFFVVWKTCDNRHAMMGKVPPQCELRDYQVGTFASCESAASSKNVIVKAAKPAKMIVKVPKLAKVIVKVAKPAKVIVNGEKDRLRQRGERISCLLFFSAAAAGG